MISMTTVARRCSGVVLLEKSNAVDTLYIFLVLVCWDGVRPHVRCVCMALRTRLWNVYWIDARLRILRWSDIVTAMTARTLSNL